MKGREKGRFGLPKPPRKVGKKSSIAGFPNAAAARQHVAQTNRSIMESRVRLQSMSRVAMKKKDDDSRRSTMIGLYSYKDMDDLDGDGDWTGGPKELIPPVDQVVLTEKELKEEFTRVLNAKNPHAPPNIVQFYHKDRVFKQLASIEQTAMHFSLDSNLIHKDGDEAQRQLNRQKGLICAEEESEHEEVEVQEEEVAEEEGKEEEEVKHVEEQVQKRRTSLATGSGEQRLHNQFNFSERASQTLNNPCRERETVTELPPRVNFSATANQMEIFDAYVEDLIKQEKTKEKKVAKSASAQDQDFKKESPAELQIDDIAHVGRVLNIMERMVNQNTFDDIAQDFKYYDDPADEYRDSKGSLLPLWRFRYEKARKIAVTSLCWNPLYKDLFAVGYGSYEFGDQGTGLICFYSLKNPSYPEYVFPVTSGVMSLDSHSEHAFLLAAGMYDGSVSIYDLKNCSSNPIYKSTAQSGKHTDPVWQVCWQKNDMDGNINFSSVSSDGRVVTWKLVKNELQHQETVMLNIPGGTVAGPEGTQNRAISSGTAIGFNPMAEHLFLVGSEEGSIYKCSKAHTSKYMEVYQAHHMAVHAIHWNAFHRDVFASCGADWTVKIWDHNFKEPMFSFDLHGVVDCVAWAPYASTLLAAVTAEGKVYVFDLAINKYEPLAVQSVIQKRRTKLTYIKFNPTYPILLVGDDRGGVVCLKLSPNLRRALKEKTYSRENEVCKMNKLISFVREPLLEEDLPIAPSSPASTN